MPTLVDLLEVQVAALRRFEESVPGGFDAMRIARDTELLEVVRGAQGVVRLAQAALTAASGEIARRSELEGDANLARRLGERSAVGLVAKQAGVPARDAASLVKVGEATRPNEALSGEELQPKRPHIAAALAAGTLSVHLAELFGVTLEKVAHKLWFDQATELEARLVRMAVVDRWSVAELARFCKRLPDHLDPENAEQREEALRRLARIVETRLPNGLLRVTADLDPELEGWWRAAMAAKTAPRRMQARSIAQAARHGAEGGAADSGRADSDPAEWKLEALRTVLRQSLQADDGQAAGVDVTMLVTIDLEALTTGIGAAHIADVDQPISAATARRLACQANVIPQVLDRGSVVLDQGLAKRLFTKHQRYALATRDQGCTFPGCPMPPGMCEVNHIGRWRHREEHGRGSDLNNAALLCGLHNRLMEQGWEMELRGAEPWFTPPATVDPTRTPLRGGKPRLSDIA